MQTPHLSWPFVLRQLTLLLVRCWLTLISWFRKRVLLFKLSNSSLTSQDSSVTVRSTYLFSLLLLQHSCAPLTSMFHQIRLLRDLSFDLLFQPDDLVGKALWLQIVKARFGKTAETELTGPCWYAGPSPTAPACLCGGRPSSCWD